MKPEVTIDKLEKALSLRRQIIALEERLATLFGGKGRRSRSDKKKARPMSAATRAKLSAAAKARWAKRRKGKSIYAGHPGISAVGRRKLSAAKKARWTTRRKKRPVKKPPPTGIPGTFYR